MEKPIPIDDNDMTNEPCPCGGKHSLVYNSDTKKCWSVTSVVSLFGVSTIMINSHPQ